jgi:hypothetical protein
MTAEHPRVESLTIADEGHAPLLTASHLLNRIAAFIAAVEGQGPPADAVIPRPEARFDLDAPASPNALPSG